MIETGRKVLAIEAKAIQSAVSRLGSDFASAVDILFATRGRVVVTGMGKSGIIGKKISATLTSTGTPSIFLHPSEALHGDIGIIHSDDTVMLLSTSGETPEILRLINHIKRIGVKMVALVGNPQSTLSDHSTVNLDCSVEQEACPIGLVPSTSTTLTLAMGDALAISLMEKKGFSEDDFRYFHPGGSLAKKMLKVKHLMHRDDELPVVPVDAHMREVISTIDEKHFGVAIVTDTADHVVGIVTDGDLRRSLLKGVDFKKTRVDEIMTSSPMTIEPECLAVEALKVLEEKRITSLIVTGEENLLQGLLHLHDLWRTEMI